MNNQYPNEQIVSRRDFLNLSFLSFGALGIYPWMRSSTLSDFPQAERLGRVAVGKVNVKIRPDEESRTVDVLYEDSVVTWLRETIGRQHFRVNQKWVETPDGYIWAPHVQPVLNQENKPVRTLSDTSLGSGMWVEVSVPYVDLLLYDIKRMERAVSRKWWKKESAYPTL